jgi:hypothetical protein
MPLFGWRNSADDSDDDHSSKPLPPEALPPPDPSVRELEELLAQAKVGTHEFAHVSYRSPQSAKKRFEQEHDLDETRDVPALPDMSLKDANPSSLHKDAVLVEAPVLPDTGSNDFVIYKMPESELPASAQEIVAVDHPASSAHTSIPMETARNTALSIFRTPKLRLLTEEKAIPAQLHNFQQQSCRKRHEFQTRLHDLECRIAKVTADVAHEEMNLDLDLRHALATKVYQPMEAAIESISLVRYASASGGPSLQNTTSLSQRWLTLERRLSKLDAKMIHSLHVELPELRHKHLTSWRTRLDSTVGPEYQDESATWDRRETADARRWENQAGLMARRLVEERATRVATLMNATTQLRDLDPCRGHEFMGQIAALRDKLQRERDERRAQDERIRTYIAETFEFLKLAILEANPDPED